MRKFIFYNFIIYDHDAKCTPQHLLETDVIYKAKKKLNPITTLNSAINEVLMSFISNRKYIVQKYFLHIQN